ncbi:MAG TPA: peptide chain release factor N(5)-glutamine methyltransferase [bacterium]|nr:peptide chain release factor N(5)-glutamine methyltransferase [bacterium]
MSTLTIFGALTWAANTLKASEPEQVLGARNSKLDAQILLAACLKKNTAYLFAHGEEMLPIDISDQFMRLVERRARHEPVAYLLGEKDFYRRSFIVSPATLIPRPETELLVDLVRQEIDNNCLVIDIGTGSGAIAVTLAAETGIETIAIDQSHEALKIAHQNAKNHEVADKIAFLEGNLMKPFFENYSSWAPQSKPRTLLIAANLPYLTGRQWETLDPDVKDYEPQTALVGGLDGLELYDELLMQLAARRKELPEQVKIFFEIDPSQTSAASSLIRHYFREATTQSVKDLSGNYRFVTANLFLL